MRSKGNQSDVVCKIYCNQNHLSQKTVHFGKTIQPLQHRFDQHCGCCYVVDDSAVSRHAMFNGNQTNANYVMILNREEKWCKRGSKESMRCAQEHPLNHNGNKKKLQTGDCAVDMLCHYISTSVHLKERKKKLTGTHHFHWFLLLPA